MTHPNQSASAPAADSATSIDDDDDNSIPDMFELNDWMLEFEPVYYSVIKYLPGIPFCRCARKLWELRGRPDIRGPAAD